MPSKVPLILSQEPVTRGMLTRMKVSTPNIAIVYADALGRVAYFAGRPPTWSQQVWSNYRIRYEVDLSDHRRTAQLDSSPLPSCGDTYYFRSMVDVGFRVSDPAKVVIRNVTDALPVVYNYLIDAFRPITRRHEIKDAKGAEAELNLLFLQPTELEEGITIYRCRTRLRPDAVSEHYLRSHDAGDRALRVGQAEYKTAATAARSQELAETEQKSRLAAESRELQAMSGQSVSLQGLIQAHLARHPDDTAYALELLQRHEEAQMAQRDINDKRTMDLVRYLLEQGLIQAVDVDMLRQQALGRVQQITSLPATPDLAAGSWDDPSPGIPAQPHSPPALVSSGHGAPAHADHAYAIPVYVTVDESLTAGGYLESLNRGIRALPSDLARYPEVIAAIRLAVLGYAGDAQIHMPLNAVAAGSYVPVLTARSGANLAAVLEKLRERISEDVTQLKSRGLTVGRPTLYLLSATADRDESAWDSALRRLTDQAAFPPAPNILALGVGAASSEIVMRIAEQPRSRGWVASPGTPLSDGVENFATFVRGSIISLSHAYVTGRPYANIDSPKGFRPIGERA